MDHTKERFEKAIQQEWILTNGIGGYSSSTTCCCNTRKYHGILVAALGKGGERFVCLPKLDESIFIRGEEYTLATNECRDFIEKGYTRQTYFQKEILPQFTYEVKENLIVKEIAMKHGENKVAISYHILAQKDDLVLELKPFVNYRSFHQTKNCFEMPQSFESTKVNIALNSHGDILHMGITEGEYIPYNRVFYRNMYYRVEEERGLEAYENHFMPGAFRVTVPKNTEKDITFVASVDQNKTFLSKIDGADVIRGEKVRMEKLFRIAQANTQMEKQLVMAADSFLVNKNGAKTIIAGYHWFGDWGRDTFISLEGLTLKLNRFKEAKEIIESFQKYLQDGLVPNLISEDGGSAYNSVDASLWYINAIYRYYKYTMDREFVQKMYPVVLQIIEAYKNGTRYDIKMDPNDCLISAGNAGTQLTWMDAKVGDVIPTPRYGKPVEINALWYNALKIAEVFSNLLAVPFDTTLSEKVKDSFEKYFLENGLYDTLDPNNAQIRPNQVVALALSFSPVGKERARKILEYIRETLYTPKGLKTLSPSDAEYQPYYVGDVYHRDLSYHQGTVWPYLLMFYNAAVKTFEKRENQEIAYESLLNDGCVGSVCEIYDGDSQEVAKGAVSQAWSVAMMIENLF